MRQNSIDILKLWNNFSEGIFERNPRALHPRVKNSFFLSNARQKIYF